jgi:hypothetical protein
MTPINKILHDHLAVKMICSRWIPHNLAIAQKEARVDWCKEILQKSNHGVSNGVFNIYASMHMSPRQNSLWVFQDESIQTKIVRTRSTSKQMVACLFGKI